MLCQFTCTDAHTYDQEVVIDISDHQLSELDWVGVGIFRRIWKMRTKQVHLTWGRIAVNNYL